MKETIANHEDIINTLEWDYLHYVEFCQQRNVTPLKFRDWIHSDTPCDEPLHNHHDGCPVCDMPQ